MTKDEKKKRKFIKNFQRFLSDTTIIEDATIVSIEFDPIEIPSDNGVRQYKDTGYRTMKIVYRVKKA